MRESRSGFLAWFAGNHVASNLLMAFLLVAGALSLLTVVIEVFPEFDVDLITVTVPYLGATPAEVEEGVCVRVEEAVASIEGIKRLKSTAQEGVGTISIEILEDARGRVDLGEVGQRELQLHHRGARGVQLSVAAQLAAEREHAELGELA